MSRAPPTRLSGPFSRPIDVRDVGDDGLAATIEANAEECAAVAAQAGVEAIAALAARCRIDRRPGSRFVVTGEVEARLTQICVVTLEPFESTLAQPIDVAFADPPRPPTMPNGEARSQDRRRPQPVRVHADEDDADPADPLTDETIDLGAVAVEFLTLGLDLYPRKPGARFTDVVSGDMGADVPPAFAGLQKLKDRS